MLLSFDGLNNYFGSMELNDCLMMVSYDDLIIVSYARLKGYFFEPMFAVVSCTRCFSPTATVDVYPSIRLSLD